MLPDTLFALVIRDPKGVVFEGSVRAISGQNQRGSFDIIAGHAHFITLISEKLIVHLQDGSSSEYPVASGVLRCTEEKVDIYLALA